MALELGRRVAVVGVGCTPFGELYEKSAEDLLCDAVDEALADAGCERERIEAAWVGAVLSPFGGDALADALTLFGRPMTRVQNYCASGMDAFRNACLAVAAGMHDVVLAVGFEKMRDGGFARPNRSHPVVDFGERAPHVFALSANRYFNRYGAGKKTLAAVAVKNHRHGRLSPKAHLRMDVSEETVLRAPMVYSPLGLFDCCPTTDGAAAALICRADIARSFRGEPVGRSQVVRAPDRRHRRAHDLRARDAAPRPGGRAAGAGGPGRPRAQPGRPRGGGLRVDPRWLSDPRPCLGSGSEASVRRSVDEGR